MEAVLLTELQKLIQESKIIPDHHKQEWLNGLPTLNDAKGEELKAMLEKEPPLEKELEEAQKEVRDELDDVLVTDPEWQIIQDMIEKREMPKMPKQFDPRPIQTLYGANPI